eukprot:6190573-Pleurochrysis_carterae.AAC.1
MLRDAGIQIVYAPGMLAVLQRCMPTSARGSSRALDTATRGLTAKARHPKGMVDMTDGLAPHVYGVFDGVVPEGGGSGGRGEVGTRQLHGCPDRPFCDSVERMNVRRRGCGVHEAVGEQFSEVLRDKLASVISVNPCAC